MSYYFYRLSDGLYSGNGYLEFLDQTQFGYTSVEPPNIDDPDDGVVYNETRHWTGEGWEIIE
jgi:hypothetical protein